MTQTKSRELRTKRRIPFKVLVECQETHGRRKQEMYAQDISPRGVRLSSMRWAGVNRCPKEGTTLTLTGLVYTEKGSLPLEGKVAWAKTRTQDASFELGLRFVNPNKNDVLEEFDRWEEQDWKS